MFNGTCIWVARRFEGGKPTSLSQPLFALAARSNSKNTCSAAPSERSKLIRKRLEMNPEKPRIFSFALFRGRDIRTLQPTLGSRTRH